MIPTQLPSESKSTGGEILDNLIPPEYNSHQLHVIIHALEMLDTSQYDLGYTLVHKNILNRFREQLKKHQTRYEQ